MIYIGSIFMFVLSYLMIYIGIKELKENKKLHLDYTFEIGVIFVGIAFFIIGLIILIGGIKE